MSEISFFATLRVKSDGYAILFRVLIRTYMYLVHQTEIMKKKKNDVNVERKLIVTLTTYLQLLILCVIILC